MLSYHALIIEDDVVEQQLLQLHLNRLPYLTLVGAYANPLLALPLLQNSPVDILFLDVNLPGMDGLSFLNTLQRSPRVILTTADPTYALSAYEAGVVDYLVKPYTFERLLRAVGRAVGLTDPYSPATKSAPTHVFLKTGRESVRVAVSDIVYAEAFGAFSKVHTTSTILIVSELLSDLHHQLPAGAFIRVHKSYIVARHSISRISSKFVAIDQHQIPLGATYRDEVEKALQM